MQLNNYLQANGGARLLTWELFQTLLRLLRDIADRHGGVSIANVATRWVLEHQFVGAVIIGAVQLLWHGFSG